ncbi:MAG: hypothetical protein JHC33_11105 [Ignisphaera sp.]|nr:hypothetical protein [Ignisphaera sp.]
MFIESPLYAKAVDKFGKQHQLGVTIEEMGECIASISQFTVRGRDREQDAIEEIADVCIMMAQMHIIYGDKLTEAIVRKLEKLNNHLKD